MKIDRVYTFKGGFSIRYQRAERMHRLIVQRETPAWLQHGPWIAMPQLVSYDIDGRFFIGQSLTELMPDVFELVPSEETICETAEPRKGKLII